MCTILPSFNRGPILKGKAVCTYFLNENTCLLLLGEHFGVVTTKCHPEPTGEGIVYSQDWGQQKLSK